MSWEVGGQQGQGIESTGDILASVLNHRGYWLYGYRSFSSRIKGGHTHYTIRVSTKPVRTIREDLDILVAFDQETIDLSLKRIKEDGIILADSAFHPVLPSGIGIRLYGVPFYEIARGLGNVLMRNMAAIGATSVLFGMDPADYQSTINELFGRKGPDIVRQNIEALHQGAKAFAQMLPSEEILDNFEPGDGKRRMFMLGNEAIALGAIAGGARLMSAYPITPASEIMEYMIQKLPHLGGAVVQTEDEISACSMAIGANYAGARAFTATSGPGLSLMMEAVGLAGMTETPLVLIDAQRGGPSTGLPTKQEQSDILAAIYGSHGDVPKIVMAPSTVEEAFYDTAEAFNLAEEFQCPVILLSDLQMSLGKQTVEPLNNGLVQIRRGKYDPDEERPPLSPGHYFPRYEPTTDGISERTTPGMRNGVFHTTGIEHDASGKPVEEPANRRAQMEKRVRKMEKVVQSFPEPLYLDVPYPEPELLVVGILSVRGAVEEALAKLRLEGRKVNYAQVRLVYPFPTEVLRPLVDQAKAVAVVEQNISGQLANLCKMHFGCLDKIRSVVKYDGTPFFASEVYDACQEVL